MIYLDNAATTFPKPKKVIDSLNYAVENFTSPGRGHYKSSAYSSKMVYELRCSLANFFGISEPLNVAFTSNATESINLVINALFDENDHVITSIFDHNSVIRPLTSNNISYDLIQIDNNYDIDYNSLPNLVKKNTKAVILTHSSNILGTIVDIEKISKFCKEENLLLILDVAQTAGFCDIDMSKNNIDILCFTAHKSFYGISGVGGIVVNDSSNIEFKNTKTGGTGNNSLCINHDTSMPEVFEAGTTNFIGLYALKHGLEYISNIGLYNIREHETKLCNYVYANIKDIDGIKIFGNFNTPRTPVIAFCYKDYDSNDISDLLAEKYDIATRSGFHCVAFLHEKIGTTKTGLVRISFSVFNTIDDALKVSEAILEICK